MQLMTTKTMTIRTLYVHVVLNGVVIVSMVQFFDKFHDIVPFAPHFVPVRFLPKSYFNKLCFQLLQNISWPMNNARDQRKFRHKLSKIGPSHLLREHGDLSFLLCFSKQCSVENIQGKFQNKIGNFNFRGMDGLIIQSGSVIFFLHYQHFISTIGRKFWQSVKNSVGGVQSHLNP